MSEVKQEAMDVKQEAMDVEEPSGAADGMDAMATDEDGAAAVEVKQEQVSAPGTVSKHEAAAEPTKGTAAAREPAAATSGAAASKKRGRQTGNTLKVGHCTFHSCKEAKDFFRKLLHEWPRNIDVNEYEHLALLDLLKLHPKAAQKIGVGIAAFQAREYGKEGCAFFVVRKDNTVEDFSYLKCLAEAYPGEIGVSSSSWNKGEPKQQQQHGRGRGQGRGRGRGGQGGRGGGRGR